MNMRVLGGSRIPGDHRGFLLVRVLFPLCKNIACIARIVPCTSLFSVV